MLLLTASLACAPCVETGYHEGSVLGDREGLVALELSMLEDESLIDIVGYWLPEGLPRTADPNLVTTRGCNSKGPTVLDYSQSWYDRNRKAFVEWSGQITLLVDEEGVHGGWDMEVWSGQAEDSLNLDEELVGQWRVELLE